MRTYLKYKEESKSVGEVALAIKTIKKMSATKLKKQKQIFERNADFLNELNILNSDIGIVLDKQKFSYPLTKEAMSLLIVITGNKGLVGHLYQDILDLAKSESAGKMLVCLGLKSESMLGNKFASFALPDDPAVSNDIQELLLKIKEMVKKGEVSDIKIAYPTFNSFTNQKPVLLPIYPINFTAEETPPKMLITEPGKNLIITDLTDLYIKTAILKAISETILSEVAARLVNSQKADDKSQQLLKQSVKNYLKARKVDVTRQQLEGFVGHIL